MFVFTDCGDVPLLPGPKDVGMNNRGTRIRKLGGSLAARMWGQWSGVSRMAVVFFSFSTVFRKNWISLLPFVKIKHVCREKKE